MKICLATLTFLPTIGGAELAVHHLSKTLTKMGVEVTVFAPKKVSDRKFHADYNIEYYPRMPKGYLQGHIFGMYLFFLQKRHDFDLIHVHKAQMAYYVTRIKRLLKVPIILTTHGGDIQSCPEIGYGDRLDPVWNKRIEYAVKNAELLTSISSSTRKRYMDIGVPENRIVDIPNGVDLIRFNEGCDNNIRNLLGLPTDIQLILAVGRYHLVKGYEYLITAISYVKNQFNNLRCLIIGKKLDELGKLIKELNVGEYIILLNQQSFNHSRNNFKIDPNKLPNDILFSAYKSSDIYVSSSLIEGFSLTLVEAMAAGLPIIATNVAGNEDAVIDGVNGFLVPPKDPKALADKIIKLLKRRNLRAKLGSKSRELAREYDWGIIADQYFTAYKSLISGYD